MWCGRFFADILLTPLEATRIRLVSQRGYATGLVSGFSRLAREEGMRGLYSGFLPILCKCVTSALVSHHVSHLSIRYRLARPPSSSL